MLEFFLSSLTMMLVVVDPIGLAPIFITLTHGLSSRDRRATAIEACIITAIVLAGFALGGNWLLRQLGIGLPAFRIGGGLLLFVIAFEMVFERRAERKASAADSAYPAHTGSVAAFPLAIPLMAGPGAITAALLLASRAGGLASHVSLLLLTIVVVCLCCLAVFLFATRMAHVMSRTGQIVFARILGVLLAALAVQFVIDGIREAIVAPPIVNTGVSGGTSSAAAKGAVETLVA